MNTIAPVHIRQDSLVHNVVAKFVKLDGETENYYAFGDALMYGAVRLKQAFGGTGYNGEVRHFPDFASRMYFMESVEKYGKRTTEGWCVNDSIKNQVGRRNNGRKCTPGISKTDACQR